MAYSYTRLTTFENCPLQYRYKYLEKPTATLGDTIEAYLGQRIHEVLEKLYRDLKMTILLSLEEAAGYYRKNWEKHWRDSIRVIKNEYSPEDYFRRGQKCLEDYYRRYHPFDQGRTIGIEERVNVDLGSGRLLTGYIDRVALLEDGRYEIHDYKTSNHLPPQEEVDGDRQLALYQLGVQSMWNDVGDLELVWHYLVFDRELRSRRTPEDLEKLKKSVNLLIDTIESTEEFNPKPSSLCDWCEFGNICPLWKHRYLTDKLAPEEFKEDDGVRMVDRYTAITEEEAQLKGEKEKLKDALARFCAAFGYEVVYGTDQKIRVKRSKYFYFPPAGEEVRRELEELIRQAGRWDEFSSLNVKQLEAALRKGLLPEEFKDQLARFCREEEGVRLIPSKIKSEEK